MQQISSQQVEDSQTVIDVLIDGLRISDRQLNETCLAAIVAIGESVVPHLLAAANDRATRAPHRHRLFAVVESIRSSPAIDARTGELVWDALLDALRVHNERLNAKAVAAIGRMPSGSVNLLITEAVHKLRSRRHCARLLRAADEVNGMPDSTRQSELLFLATHKDETVRRFAMRLHMKLRGIEVALTSCPGERGVSPLHASLGSSASPQI